MTLALAATIPAAAYLAARALTAIWTDRYLANSRDYSTQPEET